MDSNLTFERSDQRRNVAAHRPRPLGRQPPLRRPKRLTARDVSTPLDMTIKRDGDASSSSLSLGRGKPACDFEFATHLGGVTGIDREIKIFKHDKSFRLLKIVKK